MAYHTSVLLNEAVTGLDIVPNGIYIDGTTGGGGHSIAIARKLAEGRLLCIDRDVDALNAARERLKDYDNITFVHDNFKNLNEILDKHGIDFINGIILDLGVSSYQIDTKERGFSYMESTAPLDMRMDRSEYLTAAAVLNTYEKDELAKIFCEYGEEKKSRQIAEEIIKKRKTREFVTTGDLISVIEEAAGKNRPGGHPAKRVFQALRIEVNGELRGLYDFIYNIPDRLCENGRISIITFHSLEDRIVKQAYKKMADPCTCPRDFPVCVCGKKPKGVLVNKKPILPTEDEIKNNSRSKSAKLRIFESKRQEDR